MNINHLIRVLKDIAHLRIYFTMRLLDFHLTTMLVPIVKNEKYEFIIVFSE